MSNDLAHNAEISAPSHQSEDTPKMELNTLQEPAGEQQGIDQLALPPHAIATFGTDLSSLRLPQNFGATLGVKKLLSRAPVQRPKKTVWFRVHAGADERFQAYVLELKEHQETYLVDPSTATLIPDLVKPVEIRYAIDRMGNIFLIPIVLPDPTGRVNTWAESLAQAVNHATRDWIRITANMAMGGYEIFTAPLQNAEPDWPDFPFTQVLEKAFEGRIIRTEEHPVIQSLLGRA